MTLLPPVALLAALLAGNPGVELAVAVERGDVKAVTALLDAGTPVDIVLSQGEGQYSALQLAAWNGKTAVAKLLLERGASVNATSPIYGCALIAAAGRGWDDLVAVLIENGAEVDQRDERGNRALTFALGSGDHDLVAQLLKAGARLEESGEGYTPLMDAAKSDDAEAIRMLVKAGAKINVAAKGQYGGFNPLLLSAEMGYVEALKALIELKANLNVRDAEGKSALQLAREGGHDEIVALLKAAGAVDGKAPVKKP